MKPTASFVVTRRIEGTRLGDDVRNALTEYALPVMTSAITQRQVYPQTASEGRTIFDSDNVKARREVDALREELCALVPVTKNGSEVRNGTYG